MRWPVGRYNGRRIVGIEIDVKVDVIAWRWCLPSRWGRCLGLGPVRIWVRPAYEHEVMAYRRGARVVIEPETQEARG